MLLYIPILFQLHSYTTLWATYERVEPAIIGIFPVGRWGAFWPQERWDFWALGFPFHSSAPKWSQKEGLTSLKDIESPPWLTAFQLRLGFGSSGGLCSEAISSGSEHIWPKCFYQDGRSLEAAVAKVRVGVDVDPLPTGREWNHVSITVIVTFASVSCCSMGLSFAGFSELQIQPATGTIL